MYVLPLRTRAQDQTGPSGLRYRTARPPRPGRKGRSRGAFHAFVLHSAYTVKADKLQSCLRACAIEGDRRIDDLRFLMKQWQVAAGRRQVHSAGPWCRSLPGFRNISQPSLLKFTGKPCPALPSLRGTASGEQTPTQVKRDPCSIDDLHRCGDAILNATEFSAAANGNCVLYRQQAYLPQAPESVLPAR